MSATVEPDNFGRSADAERTLQDAAGRLGCSVETLRRRIRAGTLPARRGQYGTYLVRDSDLVMVRLRPSAHRAPVIDEDLSWDLLARLVRQYPRTREAALALLVEVKADPTRYPRIHRMATVQRLRLMGLTYTAIAAEVGRTERQVRRIARRDLEMALRRQLFRNETARVRQAPRDAATIVTALEERMRNAGYRGAIRADLRKMALRRPEAFQRLLSREAVLRLRELAIPEVEINAIRVAGISLEALNWLLTYGNELTDPVGHESHLRDGAR